ncbi:MAG: hypothetical protein QOE89_185 [Pseudonocardiales bacterium]|nr:hypothetical protein [Pseudonocardiales bacterium]
MPLFNRRPRPSQLRTHTMFLTEDREILVDEDSLARVSRAWRLSDDASSWLGEDLDPVDAIRPAGRVLEGGAPGLRENR